MHKPLLTLCLTLITLTVAAEAPPDAALMQQAEAGDAEAQFLVGRYYMHRDDWANAMPWFDKAAAQGHPKALNNGGIGYMEGRGVRKDIAKGCRMMEESYEKMGGTKGAANVAFCNDERHDYGKAIGYYRIAATQGDRQAQRLLGQMYGSGDGTAKDDVQAVYWLRQAALQDDAQALYELGLHYARAQGVPDNGNKNNFTAYLFMKAAESRQTPADQKNFARARFAENLAKLEAAAPPEERGKLKALEAAIKDASIHELLQAIDTLVPYTPPNARTDK
ncbi:tetratricopeptide repeat protein [uncultured Cardiobacterium sp.]|uniref:tetratricopeptide repeat protein n=1 Tax=uncultured Cardiobacterium sp. TaxID=417619 RepID=UPI00260A8E27|nr:tetratricopeptide repeat protein [uncultured Cardiobacterium sp.]